MDMQYELEQSEEEFRKIVELLDPEKDSDAKDVADAYIIAWRMMMRLEEQRLRHPC